MVLDFETADIQNLLGGSSPLFPAKMMVSKQKNPQTRVQDLRADDRECVNKTAAKSMVAKGFHSIQRDLNGCKHS